MAKTTRGGNGWVRGRDGVVGGQPGPRSLLTQGSNHLTFSEADQLDISG